MARRALLLLVVVAAALASAHADKYRDALMELYTATGGDNWKNNAGWGTSAPYCTWYGVGCPLHTTQDITAIKLINNGLTGQLPASLGTFNMMKEIQLQQNNITGKIPPIFGDMPALVILDLSFNQLSGGIPANMVNFTFNWPTLRVLNINNNQLTGSLPEEMFGPATLPPFYPALNLQTFNAQYNQLTGSIPERVTRGNVLTTFMLGYNQMTGIPSSIADWLDGRKYCDLEGNNWACPIPEGVTANCRAYCKH